MGMTIDELKCIIGEYKLLIPPTAYYDLLADLEDAEFIPKADYENRLKADMVDMLTEILTDFDNQIEPNSTRIDCESIIEQKINSLKD